MIRTFLEYLIQNSLDRGNGVPRWLRWFEQRDPQLRRYERESQKLDSLLRSSARTVRRELAVETREPVLVELQLLVSQSSSRFAWAGWLAATAAALVGVAMFLNHTAEQQANAQRMTILSTQLATMPDDMLSLLSQAARTPRDLSPLAQLSLPEVNVWRDLPRGAQGQLKTSFDEFGSQWTAIGERVYERFEAVAQVN
jgi:hypothetical protein